MKTINYFWHGLTSFVEGYVPFFSMITSIAAAFAISVFFPAITLLVFVAALLAGGIVAKIQINKARKQNELMQQLDKNLKDELREKVKLKKQYRHNKEHYEHLVELINLANQHKFMLRKAHAYCDHLYTKTQYMHHNEREIFLKSHACQQINKTLPILKKTNLSEHEFKNSTNQLEKLIEPSVRHAELTIFTDKYQLHHHHYTKTLLDHPHKTVSPVQLETFRPTKLASTAVGFKTSLLTFGFSYSITAIATSLILSMSPILLVASFPIAAIGVALGLMTFALGLGIASGAIYHKVIAPQKAYLMEIASKIPLLTQKNHELQSKLSLEKTLIEEQRQHLKEIEEDNHLMHMQVMQKAESLHEKLDPEYHQVHKLGVTNALHVANHPHIKDHQPKPIPQIMQNTDELLPEVVKHISLEER